MVLKCYYDKYDEISLYIDDKKEPSAAVKPANQ